MILIKIEVINTLLSEDLIQEFKTYGFDLNKDLKNAQLSKKEFIRILQDLAFDVNAVNINGNKIIQIGKVSIYKMRYKDENRHIGSSGGYRLVTLLIVDSFGKAIPFHIYHKHAGKKPKADLTEKEKKMLKKLAEDINNRLEE